MQLGDGLAEEVVGGGTLREQGKRRVPPEPRRQPPEPAVADERVLCQPKLTQPVQRLEDVHGQRRQVVVVQRPEIDDINNDNL